ncbi:MAG: HlyD family secretion protein [Bacteroidia bacterium]|nr:HlyD family secretion protein [Bacteroidia bacterium]
MEENEKNTMEDKEKSNGKNKKLTRFILIALIAAAAIIGIIEYRLAQRYETTDDAQLETDISPVMSRVQGYIDKINFTDNQKVNKGDTLVILDNRDLLLREQQAQAALQSAQASLEVTKTNAESSEEDTKSAGLRTEQLAILLGNAQKDFDRYKKMFEEHSATQQEYDRKKTDMESLQKQVEASKQQQNETAKHTEAAREQVDVAASQVKQRQTDLDYAKLQVSYSYITAPFNGVVAKKNAVKGQLLQAGQAVCAIINPQDIWITANFKETQVKKMKAGMAVEVEVDAFPGKIIHAHLASSSPATGSEFSLIPPDNASGNFVKVVQRIPVRIELDRNDEMYSKLKPGMSVYVSVVLE